MKMSRCAAIIIIPALLWALSLDAKEKILGLYFPGKGVLKQGERIDEFHLKVACGHIESIVHIPDDWNIEVVRAISAVEELHASAGHGGSMLDRIEQIDGMVLVTIEESACFRLSASLIVNGQDTVREIELANTQVELRAK